MKTAKILLCFSMSWTFCLSAIAQKVVSSAKIISVKAGNNQKDSTFIDLKVSQKEPIKLSYDQNYVHFSFINTKNPSQKSFSYKLLGLDYSWITCDSCSQVQYAHLDGGDYIFQVKPAKTDELPTEFSFVIEGNVWHRWWFVPMLFMYFLIVLGVGIYFFVLYRFRQQLKGQRNIHQAKMTSMAELTSGIAHEIQNPLNFVNNFAVMSVDLAKELKEEIDKTEIPENDKEYIDEILTDLIQNQEKINHHGKRASSIVSGMLEHSRVSTGIRELTDINKLVNESLQLSFHGFRSKTKNTTDQFNAEFKTDFDENLPKINVIPQDIGRVLINLMNNAFYACSVGRTGSSPAKVIVSTKKLNNSIEIRVTDNGTGMSEATKAKIFQPFFTTKPTGQGTGLGLSLAYDIVTKGHGGTIEVESVEGEGATFVVKLPI